MTVCNNKVMPSTTTIKGETFYSATISTIEVRFQKYRGKNAKSV